MTQKQLNDILNSTIEEAKLLIQTQAPVRSGYLMRSIKVRTIPNGWEIYVDKAVYYMPYTEEEWISPRWRGRNNPNEAWFKMAVDLVAKLFAYKLGAIAWRS